MEYTASYMQLYHGTAKSSATKIKKEGFLPSKPENSWCGGGVYFYDIKAKAWWSANRTCEELQKKGIKDKPAVVRADIIDLPCKDILDLRAYKDICDFEKFCRTLMEEQSFDIDLNLDKSERIIILRSLIISFYAEKYNKKLVIGNFKQRHQPLYEGAISFSDSLDMIFGIETIYCVKDSSIIKNIR